MKMILIVKFIDSKRIKKKKNYKFSKIDMRERCSHVPRTLYRRNIIMYLYLYIFL